MPVESEQQSISETPPDFLAEKWNLHKQPEVERSVETLRDEGEKIPDTKTDRIEAHFHRVDRALEHYPGYLTEQVREKLLKDYVIDLHQEDGNEDTEKINKLVQGLFESEKEILRQQGHGAALDQYGDRPKPEDHDKYKEQVFGKQSEQERTFSRWISYLSSEEGNAYPTWFKYTALRSLGKMGSRDRDAGTYSKRSATTLDPFPELSKESLAKTLDVLKSHERSVLEERFREEIGVSEGPLTEGDQTVLNDLNTYAERGDFARIYAHFQNEIERVRREREQSEGVAGEWISFPRNSNPEYLVKSLEGKGTEWCIAGLDVATSYLGQGDIWVYFSEDKSQNPVDPRACVRLVDGRLFEVRGVVDKAQNLEPQLADIAREKYKEFPGSERYEPADRDSKLLTTIEKKIGNGQEPTRDDLIFLYEINSPIQVFGDETDPRISELRATRNQEADLAAVYPLYGSLKDKSESGQSASKDELQWLYELNGSIASAFDRKIITSARKERDLDEDLPILFECEPSQIARSVEEMDENTKAFVSKLEPGVFTKIAELPNIEHLYTNFPEGRIDRSKLTIGGVTIEQLKNEIKVVRGIIISDNAEYMLDRTPVLESPEEITTIRLKVGDLGFTRNATTDEIYARAQELGLELCPAETGPHQRLKDLDQPLGDWYRIAMKQIADRLGFPSVFGLDHVDNGLWLRNDWARPDDEWHPGRRIVFRLRNVSPEPEAPKPLPQFEI